MKRVATNGPVLVAGALSLVFCSAAMAQQGGTDREKRACAGNVQRYCRPILGQGDFAVLACLQQHRQRLSKPCRKVLVDHSQ